MISESGLSSQDFGLISENSVPVPLVGVFADAGIMGKNSKVTITQKFRNTNKKAIEAIYRFPLPENAAIIGFKIVLKDKTIKGVIEEKDEAFEIYDDALVKGNGAVLLDQERPNIFTLSVGNLNPGNEVSIEIEYISALDYNNNALRFFLPTTISPRYVPDNMPDEDGIPTSNKVHPEYASEVSYGLNLKVNILKTRGMDLSSISSPSHKIKTSISDENYVIEFTADNMIMDRDFIVEAEYKDSKMDNIFYNKTQDESFIQVDFTPDLKSILNDCDRDILHYKKDIVFLLDCSGSMIGSSITQAKKALEILIKALEPGQRFNIYRFGTRYDKLEDGFLEFGDDTLKLALNFLKNTDANFGGTEIFAPLADITGINEAAGVENVSGHKDEVTNIVLITDGEVGNEEQLLDLARSKKKDFRVYAVGIGYGPNEYFIKNMASITGADFVMVHPEERIDLKIISLFKNLDMGVIENIRMDLGIDEGMIEQAPDLVNMFDKNCYSIYARLKTNIIPKNLSIKGIYDSSEVSWEIPFEKVISENEKIDDNNNFIPKFWAWEKIRELESGSITVPGSQQKERKNKNINNLIVDLSKKYGIVSSKTSFVSVEERSEEERTTGEVELIKVPTLITHGWHGQDIYRHSRTFAMKHSLRQPRWLSIEDNGFSCDKKMLSDIDEIDYFEKKFDVGDISSEARKSTKSKTKKQLKETILLEILSCQILEGGFKISSKLYELLKIDKKKIERLVELARTYEIKIDLNKKRIMIETSFILAILNEYFISDMDSWRSIVEKSKTWLNKMPYTQMEWRSSGENKSNYVEIEPLETYMENYVKTSSFKKLLK